jgi:carboxylesterase
MQSLRLFEGSEHRPFYWPRGRRGALLIHGFPGTPAEMLPLARVLRGRGWSVCAPLLPGLGPDIERLSECRAQDWLGAVVRSAIQLSSMHQPFVILGYSMGAALAAQAATQVRSEGLILLAPFWRLGGAWVPGIWPLVRLFLRRIRPLRKADFDDPQLRRGIAEFMPELDLGNPDVQGALREFVVPSSLIDALSEAGKSLGRAAPLVRAPALVVQGRQDQLVKVEQTRRLLSRIGGRVTYVEIEAAHDLLRPADSRSDRLTKAVESFVAELEPRA